MRFAAFILIGVGAAVFSAAADTIILKNGRRIVAESVTESAGRVTYQTPAGEMSVPQSAVARVDKDDYSFSSSSSAASRATPQPALSAPQVAPLAGFEEITQHAVHDDAIDFAYIAGLESDARSGGTVALEKVAAAHHAAAQFLLSKGETEGAADQYREALIFVPDNTGLLLNLAVLELRQSKFSQALDPLEHARRVAPANSPLLADIAKLAGWAYYGSNRMDRAIEQWQLSEQLRPDHEVEDALAKAERDKSEEQNYREGETAHFNLKYSGEAAPALARDILDALEEDYDDLSSQLDYTPRESIGVILYTGQAFADITRAPGWVGALNDGRIRIPVQGLRAVTPELAHVLKHELTHTFVGEKSHGRAPTWLQEGIAQWMEGRRSTTAAAALIEAAGRGILPKLDTLEGNWLGLPGDSAAIAYAWSLAVIESIIDSGGVTDVNRLIDRVATEPVSDALQNTMRTNYDDLAQQTLAYLRRAYLH